MDLCCKNWGVQFDLECVWGTQYTTIYGDVEGRITKVGKEKTTLFSQSTGK